MNQLLTVADLDGFPEKDGNRYELIDGEPYVSCAPGMPHQRVLQNLQVGPSDSGQMLVTLYVVPGCPLCAQARLWLAEHNVAYVELDVANNFGALRSMYRLTRQGYVPVFEAKGRALVRPTDEELAAFLL